MIYCFRTTIVHLANTLFARLYREQITYQNNYFKVSIIVYAGIDYSVIVQQQHTTLQALLSFNAEVTIRCIYIYIYIYMHICIHVCICVNG